jgi:hypothetical protein
MLRKADNLGKRSKPTIEILKVSRIIGRARSRLLIDTIRRSPKTPVVTNVK